VGLTANVDNFEADLNEWEFNMQTQMTKNNQKIQAFESDIN
jgi:hypothetical protein